jgi:NarL family two-component system response regulator LiaR
MEKILLYSDDMALLDYWQSVIQNRYKVVDDINELFSVEGSVVIISFSTGCHQCIEALERLVQNNNRVLVLQRVPDFVTAKQFMRLGIKGYGNALMRDHFLVAAIETLQEGMVWLHPEFTTQLIIKTLSLKGHSHGNSNRLHKYNKW